MSSSTNSTSCNVSPICNLSSLCTELSSSRCNDSSVCNFLSLCNVMPSPSCNISSLCNSFCDVSSLCNNPFSDGNTRIGITFIAQSASLSCLSVTLLLGYVSYNAFRNRRTLGWHFLRSHLDLYLLGLLFSDLIQSIGGIMDIRWIAESGITEGHFCTAQGVLEQLGDVGVALCSMAIAAHTFATLILLWQEPPTFKLPLIVLGLYAVFLTLIVGIGFGVHQHSRYYANTTYWCWINTSYLKDGIGLEYLWLWLAAAINLLLYIPVFLALKHFFRVEPKATGTRYQIIWTTREERLRARKQVNLVHPRLFLYYPAVYLVTVLPIAVSRFHQFINNHTPLSATVISGVLFSASGFFNVVVYTTTRPALLRPSAAAIDRPAPPANRPRVFIFSDQDKDESQLEPSSDERGEEHRSLRLSSTFEVESHHGRRGSTVNSREQGMGEVS